MNRLLALVPALLCTGLAAQPVTTSPTGFLNTTGNSSAPLGVFDPFFPTSTQVIQVDRTLVGSPQSIGTFYLRRSSVVPDDPTAISQNVMIEIRMTHADFSAVTQMPQPLDQIRVGPWTTVVAARSFTMPDLTTAPQSGPAPWAVEIPLDAPFAYNGTDALMFQVNLWGAAGPTPQCSFDTSNRAFAVSQGSSYGSGCMITGGEFRAEGEIAVLSGNAPTFIDLRSNPGLSSGFIPPAVNLMAVGRRSANIPLGGLCTPLLVDVDVALPMIVDIDFATGMVRGNILATGPIVMPYDPMFVGAELFLQAWGFEQSNPSRLVGSRGWRTGGYPMQPTNLPEVAMALESTAPGMFSSFVDGGALLVGRGLIVGFAP